MPDERRWTSAVSGGGRVGDGPSASPSPREAIADFLLGGYGSKAEAALFRYADAKQAEADRLRAENEKLNQEIGQMAREDMDEINRLRADCDRYREALRVAESALHSVEDDLGPSKPWLAEEVERVMTRVRSAGRLARAALEGSEDA